MPLLCIVVYFHSYSFSILYTELRTRQYTKKRTLKDGTVREYRYEKTYTTTTNIVRNAGKKQLVQKIHDCKDREKIERIRVFFEEIGI